MINHPERITLAHIQDIISGEQRHISEYVDLDRREVWQSAARVRKALENKRNGGDKK